MQEDPKCVSMIRINPQHYDVPNPKENIGLPLGALEALESLDEKIHWKKPESGIRKSQRIKKSASKTM